MPRFYRASNLDITGRTQAASTTIAMSMSPRGSAAAAMTDSLQGAELRHRERLAALEKGTELPPDPVESPRDPATTLRRGLIGVFVGIALYVALAAVVDGEIALFALIPAAYGFANLVSYLIDRKKVTGQQ